MHNQDRARQGEDVAGVFSCLGWHIVVVVAVMLLESDPNPLCYIGN